MFSFSTMGAFGCKLRSAEERPNNKRLRLEDEEEALDDAENTDPNVAKKARADEPTDYQKGLREWQMLLAADRLLSLITYCGYIGNGADIEFCEAATSGSLDLNYHRAGSTVFCHILYTLAQTTRMYSGNNPPVHHQALDYLVQDLTSKVSNGSVEVNFARTKHGSPLSSISTIYLEQSRIGLERKHQINIEPLWQAVLAHSSAEAINSAFSHCTDSAHITTYANCSANCAFKLLRDLQSRGCDLNWRFEDGGTILHRMVRDGAGECLLLFAQVDFAGIDWHIRNHEHFSPMQYARRIDNERLCEKSSKVHVLMQKWDNRWRSVTRVELDVHLPPDLSNMICQYLDGTGKPFKSREEEKKQEAEDAELQSMLDDDDGKEEEEEKCSTLDDEDFLRSIVDGTAQGEDEAAAPFVAPDMLA